MRRSCSHGRGALMNAAMPAWRMNGASRINAATLRMSSSSPTEYSTKSHLPSASFIANSATPLAIRPMPASAALVARLELAGRDVIDGLLAWFPAHLHWLLHVMPGLDPGIHLLAKRDGLPGHQGVYARLRRAMHGNDDGETPRKSTSCGRRPAPAPSDRSPRRTPCPRARCRAT